MREQIQKPAPVSQLIQSNLKPSSQAPAHEILQRYHARTLQRQAELDEELLQGKFETAQREGLEEEELLQGKFEDVQREELDEEELLQGKFSDSGSVGETAQRVELDDEELLQGKFETAQREGLDEEELLQGKFDVAQRESAPNMTGMPDNLKSGVESMSGISMDDVRVHYNSAKPAQLQAHAYTQGTDIHVAPGQEQHLPHEAWHVVQQKQGRVQPTMQLQGVNVNDNAGLEHEADVMGGRATVQRVLDNNNSNTVQMVNIANFKCPSWGSSMHLGSAIHGKIQTHFLQKYPTRGYVEVDHGKHGHDLCLDGDDKKEYLAEIKPSTQVDAGKKQIKHHEIKGEVIKEEIFNDLNLKTTDIDPAAKPKANLVVKLNDPGLFIYEAVGSGFDMEQEKNSKNENGEASVSDALKAIMQTYNLTPEYLIKYLNKEFINLTKDQEDMPIIDLIQDDKQKNKMELI